MYRCIYTRLDIKASNCVLDEKGHIKLCDFGCAKVLYPTSDFASVVSSEPACGPRTRTFLGSHHIMPIEMLQGSGYGVSVDWWAVGILLFEMIAGSPPFDNSQHLVQGKVNAETLHTLLVYKIYDTAISTADMVKVLTNYVLSLFVENPSSTLHKYTWDIPFATTAPFSSLQVEAEAVVTSDKKYSALEKLLSDSKQLISEFLHCDVSSRCGIWNLHKV